MFRTTREARKKNPIKHEEKIQIIPTKFMYEIFDSLCSVFQLCGRAWTLEQYSTLPLNSIILRPRISDFGVFFSQSILDTWDYVFHHVKVERTREWARNVQSQERKKMNRGNWIYQEFRYWNPFFTAFSMEIRRSGKKSVKMCQNEGKRWHFKWLKGAIYQNLNLKKANILLYLNDISFYLSS